MIHPILISLALALLPSLGAAQALDNCEPLRARIEASIRAKGVEAFALTVVAADAAVAGRVVGTCGQGSRKVVYAKTPLAARVPAPAKAPAVPAQPLTPKRQTRDDDILTECKDGTVSRGGRCGG